MGGITPEIVTEELGGRYFVIGNQRIHRTDQHPEILKARVMRTKWYDRNLPPVDSVPAVLACIEKLPDIVETPEFQAVLRKVVGTLTDGEPVLEILESWLTNNA